MGLQDSWFRGNILKQLEGFSDIALVCSLIFVGGLLRLPSLRLGLWRDEGATYFDAIPADLGEVFQTVAHCELNPPGFYVVMHYWMQWFGDGEIIFKGPALILGLLIIPATYGLGRVNLLTPHWLDCCNHCNLLTHSDLLFSGGQTLHIRRLIMLPCDRDVS